MSENYSERSEGSAQTSKRKVQAPSNLCGAKFGLKPHGAPGELQGNEFHLPREFVPRGPGETLQFVNISAKTAETPAITAVRGLGALRGVRGRNNLLI